MRRSQSGFTYLALLFAVALAGIVLAATGTVWSSERQREREKELIFIGNQFRQAIGNYYERSPGLVKRYPRSLNDLLKDDRYLGVKRHLRQIYVDPMTGTKEWGLIAAPEGGVMGVYSLSGDAVLKRSGFAERDAELEGKQRYTEWRFVYRPLLVQKKP